MIHQRLAALEAISRRLDPDAVNRAALRDPVIAYAERFLESLASRPTYLVTPDKGRGLLDTPIGEDGIGIDRVIDLVERQVDRPGLNPASGGHFGYIPGGGLYASSLGDYLADIGNRYAGVFFSSPGAVYLEHQLVRWMADLLGLPASAGGTLTSGGSLANLTAIVTARDHHDIRAGDVAGTVVYVSTQTHHCVAKALRIVGLGECVTRYVPLDASHRMRPDALKTMVREDRDAGLRPWLLVASAGSTDVGAVDPLDALGEVAASEGLWYHVDGAYGAFFVLTDQGRERLRGIERADSVVMDPHKTLFLPYGSGVVLVRDRATLLAAFRSEAPYLQDTAASADEPSPTDLSAELTRPFRGLRLWLPLMVHGVATFRAALEEKLLLAHYFRERVAGLGFEVGPEPDLSVVTYRWVPAAMRDGTRPYDLETVNRINAGIIDLIREDGRVYLSSTNIRGIFTLRFACVVHRSHRVQVDQVLEVLAEVSSRAERAVLAHAGRPEVPSSP
jgi:aromatic-L-amino-acid decarboxylase